MSFLLNIMNYAVVYLFYENSLTRKIQFEGRHYAILHGVFCFFLMEFTMKIPFLHVIVCLIVLFLSGAFYRESFSTKLIVLLFFIAARCLSKFLAIDILRHLMEKRMEQGFMTLSHIQMESILTCVISYIFVVIWCTVRKSKNTDLPKAIKAALLGILVLMVIGAYTVYFFLFYAGGDNPYRIFTTVLILLFGIYFFVLLVVEKLNELMNEIYDGKMKLQEKKFEEEYFYELQEKIRDLRKLRHDYKNQLLALMAVKWEDEEYLEEEIRHFLRKMDQSEKVLYTENFVLNAICKNKVTKARNSGITVNWKLTVPPRINMRCNEMGTLFGNLLDNAIEACEKVLEERNIIFIAAVKNEKMIIRMKNTRNEFYAPEKGQTTSKWDKENHGFGMETVLEIVRKYHGTLDVTETKRHYEINIIMYGIHGTDS